ncbi:MAG: hypothetical protein ABJL44_12490 [Algibacter sp.]
MITFEATENKTNKLKWFIYILIEIGLLTFIIKYSDWYYIIKTLISIPLVINLLFDIYYLKKEEFTILKLSFYKTEIVIIDNKKTNKKVSYSNLKYSIRKRNFDKHKTEIELKTKRGLGFKTFGRIHIKNWGDIFEIENELENRGVARTKWKPKTLWGKYWGIFIDIFFLTLTTGDGDLGLTEHQERSIKETTQNPIKNKKNR